MYRHVYSLYPTRWIDKGKMSQDTEELQGLVRQQAQQLKDKQEEIDAQRGMLSAAIEELMNKNASLELTLSELQTRNEELKGLLYHSSHGLRTPITNVMGLIQIMQSSELSNEATEYLRQIEDQSSKVIEIMNSLSSLAGLINRKNINQSTPVSVDINQIIKDHIHDFKDMARSHQVQVLFEADDSNPMILCSKFALEEIIKPIIMNAMVFRDTAIPGKLLISTQSLNNQLNIIFEDDGDGIEPSIQYRIFDMFYRGSQKSGGSGLGLFIARKAADMIDANIQYEPASKGSRFIVQLK